MSIKFDELEQLAKLKEQWVLSEEEFKNEKSKVLYDNHNINKTSISWLKRLWFNLIFIFIIFPLFILGAMMYPFNGDLQGIAIIILLIVSILRFNNLQMSWWYSLWLIVPIWGLYLLFLLIFKK